MTAPTVVATVPTAEFHACITGLLQHWKLPDSTPVEFTVPALWYSPPSRSEDTAFKVSSTINANNTPGSEPHCLLDLDPVSISDWLRDEWTAEIEMGTITRGGYNSFKTITWESSDKDDFTGFYYGNTSWVSKYLSNAAIPDELHIRMKLTRRTPLTTKGPHELEHLRKSADRLKTTLSFLDRPSIDVTRFRFDSCDGTSKYLYVPSQVLLQHGYFRDCHASGFSETESQPTEPSESTKKEGLPSNEDTDMKEISDSDKGAGSNVDGDSDKITDVYEDADSDAEWELEEQGEYEHTADLKFKATIHVKDFSRRTYKAFIEWALCGPLHFAPRRVAYAGYVESCKESGVEEALEWPAWAEKHCTTINDFGNFKTLTSPKSLYRLADKLGIPGLMCLCRQKIVSDFKASNVIEEITNFRNHDELLKDAFEYVRNNWGSVVQQKNFVGMLSNFPASSLEIFHETVLTKLPLNQ